MYRYALPEPKHFPPMPLVEPPKEEIRYLGDLQRLRPEPGDVFVLTCDGDLSVNMRKLLQEQIELFLNGAKVLVLCSGLKLGCVAMPEAATSEAQWQHEWMQSHSGQSKS